MLQKEYQFLKKKNNFPVVHQVVHFLRMRPVNFPTVRLAQLAMLVHQSTHLFSKIQETATLPEVKSLLNVTANDFWHYHYTLDDASAFKPKNVGSQMTENILINTVVPVLFAYGHINKERKWKEKALKWLAGIGVEKNPVTLSYKKLDIAGKSAFDSQALIELKTKYCDEKRCLECAIGNALMRRSIKP